MERIQNPTDNRKYELAITDKAKLIISGIKKASMNVTSMTLDVLTENQIDDLYTTLLIIEKKLCCNKSIGSKSLDRKCK